MDRKDQLFTNMHHAALNWLLNYSPAEISHRANVLFSNDTFQFESLGRQVSVHYPEYRIEPELDQWHILTILHYLASTAAAPLTGKQISFSQYKHGMVRGGGFDKQVEETIQKQLSTLSDHEFKKRCKALGGKFISSNADLCIQFQFMPNYPVWLKIWFADDEFPASGKMLLDETSEHYLSIEDAVTVGSLILQKLFE